MIYQVEEIKVKRNIKRKLVVVYIVILLLVLLISIFLGINLSKKYNKNIINSKKEAEYSENVDLENSNNEIIKIILEKNDKQKFINNINNIYNGEEEKRVFLTFDDGPSEAVTPYILDKLKAHNIKATFFVLGSRVKLNPELVKQAYIEGHYIANHGYSHKYNKIYASSNDVLKEYNKAEKEIQKALGNNKYSSSVFRFPGGSVGGEYDKIKKGAKKLLKNNNIAYLDWNALTNDSSGANTKEKIMKNLKKTVGNKNNVVILMHDAPDKILTYETLDDVIKYLKDKGYVFKNMYDLM